MHSLNHLRHTIDMKLGVKVVAPAVLLAILAVMILPATYAEPMDDPESLYSVTSTRGFALMRVEGEVVRVDASLTATVKVLTVWKNVTVFAVVDGQLKIGDNTYNIARGWWIGLYHKPSGRALYEGLAVNDEGKVGFIFHSRDLAETEDGTTMRIIGAFREKIGNSTTPGRIFLEAIRVKIS